MIGRARKQLGTVLTPQAKSQAMERFSRIFARTPSLRTRVAFATAIGAAIVVVIVGAIVWVGITNDRKERLDRRLDEAAGFAIPFLPRGLGEIPSSPNDQDAVITVRNGDQVKSNSDITLPKLDADYADTYINGVRYRVRTVEIRGPEPTSIAVGATYDDTYSETNNLHRRVLVICAFAIGAAALLGWLLAAFAVRPFKRLAEQTRSIEAGDEAPEVEVRGASEAVEIADAVKGMLQRIWKEQDRTKAALASARDFAAVSSHELRTPLTAMRTNLEVLATLEMPDEQRKEVINDVIRTQSRLEGTLGALERIAQGELSTSDDHVPVDITELLDRAAHDAMRIYPDLDVSLVPAPTVIIVGLPAGLRLTVDNAIANAVKHGGATRIQLSAVSSRAGVELAIDDDGVGVPEEERVAVFDRFSRGSTASQSGSGLGLALVAQQAELHGGTATLESSPLGGARLLLRLPGPS
jgi:two-component system sensor histidine kinase PrrB